jgi:hypothetical protein
MKEVQTVYQAAYAALLYPSNEQTEATPRHTMMDAARRPIDI